MLIIRVKRRWNRWGGGRGKVRVRDVRCFRVREILVTVKLRMG